MLHNLVFLKVVSIENCVAVPELCFVVYLMLLVLAGGLPLDYLFGCKNHIPQNTIPTWRMEQE